MPKKAPNKQPLKLVEAHGQKIVTTSLIVADHFEKQHREVLRKIDGVILRRVEFSKCNFTLREYIDSRGKNQRYYEMTEEGFMKIALGFTGEKAEDFQEDFIHAFQKMRKILNEPNRNPALTDKKKSGVAMCESLKFIRDLAGKETTATHYGNEYKFCYRALTGKWEKQDESTLDSYDLKLLEAIRNRNQVLMALYPKQKDRQQMLDDFVTEYRAKHPRLQLAIA